MLTYAALAERLKMISPKAARERHRLPGPGRITAQP